MSDEDVTIRAARAKQLLEDEVLNGAMANLMADALARALLTPLEATGCIAAIAALQAANSASEQLQSFITAGKAAERKPYKVA
jgi:hypothetical protein